MTFLFTDVEGSTRLLHELGAEAYAKKLAEHRRVVREACAARGGVEVDTQGDAFFVAFRTAPAALEAARSITDELASGPISVRIGLHTGTPLVTDEGYVGDDVHFAARVAASAHGGQVVLSQATRARLERYTLTDLGEHRLKDISEPVAIFQLGERPFPPLKTLANTNLPRPVSSFVGRERELSELLARIERGARLVTLTGPGGSGKTRLALEAAARLVTSYKAGVFWVGLASVRDPALVGETVAQTLGAKDGVAEHIRDREMLLLIDNFEQVIDAGVELASLLHACSNLTLLVTSRELLRVGGEVECRVPPLADVEAVSLFCERAQTPASEEIADLCRRLDNLPLAVELAAARAKVLSPAKILARLSQRLDLLKGGRDADPRQQTLRATIEWSHDLLSEREQQLFRRVAVFAGGCTLEAAEEVADAELDTLQSLVEKSLVRFASERFWMLETVREFALERLQALEERERIRRRHAELFVALAEKAEPELKSAAELVWLERLDAERGNLREAAAWALDAHDGDLALRILGALWRFYETGAAIGEGRALLRRALAEATDAEAAVRAKALFAAARLAFRQGAYEDARPLLEQSRVLFERRGPNAGSASAVAGLGWVELMIGTLQTAVVLCRRGADLARASGDDWALADALNNLGCALFEAGAPREARRAHAEALELRRRLGDGEGIAASLANLGAIAAQDGAYDDAGHSFEEAGSLALKRGDHWMRAMTRVALAEVALKRGDDRVGAVAYLAEAVALASEYGFGAVLQDAEAVAAEHGLTLPVPDSGGQP